MFVFTRCLLYAEVSQGARTAFAEKTLMEEPPEEVVSEVSSLPSVGFAAGSYWLSTTMRSWCWTNLAAVHLTFLSEWFLDRRLIPERLLLFSQTHSRSSRRRTRQEKMPLKKSKSPWQRHWTSWPRPLSGGLAHPMFPEHPQSMPAKERSNVSQHL